MTLSVWRALVVDDNAINLEVAVELLQQLGAQTDSASTGAQAVALALAAPYDLIVMDVQMPGMDGIEATRRIRQALGPLPPIVALTANAQADDRTACLAAGMNDYLTKPVHPQQLRSALQRCLVGRLAAGPGEPDSSDDAARRQGRLAAIQGLDVVGSLRNMGGQQHRLERVLQRFANTYRAGEPALMRAASQGDAAALWQACHSLRGACAVLCATQLVQRIEALEHAVGLQPDRAVWQGPAQELQAELLQLVQQLDAALAPD